ncbi:Asp-tRNA(Asn)/Glu-tRNA(Gln) amidotransferase subunit GatC [bacterium]|jgi:aspartyl-tRNA(Asn)/glutamyl-tRNA(Gln) amidotransferase subunit C|nr:Asp-tRNA(Asn)/Glu-tRNA(Gln) amidotransferase subunit GatC [bacterium]
MTFTREQVAKVADLARLHLSETEIDSMSRQLTSILEFFDQLQAIDTTGVEPMAHGVAIENVFRDDEKHPGLPPDEALANAPKRAGDFFAVPPILD